MAKWQIETTNGSSTQVLGTKLHLKDPETGSPANVFITNGDGTTVFVIAQHQLVYVKQID